MSHRPEGRLALLLPDMGGGGAERVALRLAQDFLARGYEVDLVLLQAKGELLGLVPPEVKLIDLKAGRIRAALRPLIRYFRERAPQAVQISMWPLTIVGIVAARLARSKARIVTSDHIVLTRQYGDRGAAKRAIALTTRLFYPWADARVIVSHEAADDLARVSGLKRGSLEVIYNPVSVPPAEGTSPSSDLEALWGTGLPRILTVGKLKEQKNHALLLRAFKRLLERRPAKLMILGEGPLEGELKGLAKALGLEDQVLFPGFTADPWPFYRSADLFALSSDYEGYPLVLIEAMRCGLPIVSTDCPSGPREILGEGDYGVLVPVGDEAAFADALERALDAPVDRAAIIARAEALSGQSTSDRYLQLMIG